MPSVRPALRRLISVVAGLVVAATLAGSPHAFAQSAEAEVGKLAARVERAQALRDIKRLHNLYAQFAQFGMWDEAATLFATDAQLAIDDKVLVRGQAEVAKHLLNGEGGGRLGLPVGGLNTELIMAPVITLGPDGLHAKGRWQYLTLSGQYGERADWAGGTEENDYVKEAGVWKIARLGRYPQLAGKYETGFFGARKVLPMVPYHYPAEGPGAPIPATAQPQIIPGARLDAVAAHIWDMNDEDKVRNLQNIYGYYADRKMWDDVADLFTSDGAMEIAGQGVWTGEKAIRRALEVNGPPGLKSGQVNDQLQLQTVVTIGPGRDEARARGVQLGMLTPKLGEAYWSVSVFEARYLRQGGVWRIRELRVYPQMKADYYQGWAKSRVVDPRPKGAFAPSKSSPEADSPQISGAIPVFDFPNPATGKAISYPPGAKVVGGKPLLPAAIAGMTITQGAPLEGALLAEAQRRLTVSEAYDAIENVSSTFGYYLDDYAWQRYVENYAVSGRRKKACCGFYIGRDHIFKAEAISYGPTPVNRDGIRVHTRVQPVIDVAEDGKSAFIRTRMFLYYANSRSAGAFNSGMYPNDSLVVENGVWKMNVGGAIDETYFESRGWKLGWAKPNEKAVEATSGFPAGPGGAARAEGAAGDPPMVRGATSTRKRPQPTLPADFVADIPTSAQARRGEGFTDTLPNFVYWPGIKPMWFHYRNPVSGREPENYCPDATTCFLKPGAGK